MAQRVVLDDVGPLIHSSIVHVFRYDGHRFPPWCPRKRHVRGYDRVPGVALDDLPEWIPQWCLDHRGGAPVGGLFELRQVSMVSGRRLAGGLDVVVKARADEGRAVSCVAAQARLAERGFPCARPLTPVVG